MNVEPGPNAPSRIVVYHARRAAAPPARAGFSLVELVVAVVILAVGILGMAGTTAMVVRQTTMADLSTERAAAMQSVVEEVRSTSFNSVGTGTRVIGSFTVGWSVVDSTGQSKSVRVITTGPGLQSDSSGGMPVLASNAQDTLTLTVLNP